MTDNRSDEEIAAAERARAKSWSRTAILAVAFWVAAALLLVLIFNTVTPQRPDLSNAVIIWFPLAGLVLISLVLLIYRLRHAPGRDSLRRGVQLRLIDDYARRQRKVLLVLIAASLLLALNQPTAPAGHGATGWYTQATFVVVMLMAALIIVLGPGFLNPRFRHANADEFNRALRRRTASFGYICAMAALGVDYGLSQFVPQTIGLAIPLSMAAIFILPALYYIVADWRASRDG